MELKSLGGGTGYLKAGLLGFAGSGKTYTAAKIAAGVRAHQKLTGPIAMLDTEAAAQYIAPMVRAETGCDLLGVQTRVLRDAVEFLKECLAKGVSVAILDSVTHLWREVCDSYLKQVNDKLAEKNRAPRRRMEFQDWAPIKAEWAKFSDLYLNIPLHTIICGRAGYEYDYEQREDGSGKDLVKTGVKMKTEGEFGYEPSLLIQMERIQTEGAGENTKLLKHIVHRATVLKDRFGVLDGVSCDNPDFNFFKPFVDRLTPGQIAVAPQDGQTDLKVDESGDTEWQRERKLRTIYCEEIQGTLLAAWPGMSAEEKKAKSTIVHDTFGTYSWEAVQGMESTRLKLGLEALPHAIEEYKIAMAKPSPQSLATVPVAPPAKKPDTPAEEAVKHFSGDKKARKA